MSEVYQSEGSCNSNCSSCKTSCSSRKEPAKEDFRVETNEYSTVKKVIGVVSGKGGVGNPLLPLTFLY